VVAAGQKGAQAAPGTVDGPFRTLSAAGGWCAPSGERYPAWVLEPDCPWPLPVRTIEDYRTWTPSAEQRLRWAEEDAWLRRQVQLCAPLALEMI
jgi:hypothetical protein